MTELQPEQQPRLQGQAHMLANRLGKKFKHLAKWAKRTGAGAFRLYDRDIPEIPLVLDYYMDADSGDCVSGALYKRPYEKDEKEEMLWLDAMKEAAAGALGIDPDCIIIKQRQRQHGDAQYGKQADSAVTRIITENTLRYKVNLSDYLDTGLFPDRRLLRNMVQQEAAEKRVLNLFCYTGAYSVAAAAGSASATCSVDMSNTYIGWAKDNFSLNKINSRIVSMRDYWHMGNYKANIIVRADALVFLKEARQRRCTFDAIILDPPAFSNSKKMTETLDLKRDHPRLLSQCLALLEPGGKLWFSANARSFSPSAPDLETELKRKYPAVQVSDISRRLIDEDFRGRKTPRTFLLS